MSASPVIDTPLADKIKDRLKAYYTDYYHRQLGLPDWETRIQSRFNEEDTFAEPSIRKIESWINYDFSGKRVLIVGAGTGGEAVAFARRGAEVLGIEPNKNALELLRLRAQQNNWEPNSFVEGVAESLPFGDNGFDFVYCWTVLEHVQDVEKAVDEMIRVCKKEGTVFIQVPDYRFPYEGHYKVPLIPFAPRWIQKLLLSAMGRPTEFLSTINFLTTPGLDRIFRRKAVTCLRAFDGSPTLEGNRRIDYFFNRFSRLLGIPKQQFIFLKKK
jgi:2-polyprenyl-3-methyl-5-hydroxy-6-metoxy-1,4-benzoquinol methylase